MSNTYLFAELVGSSTQGFEDAIANGVKHAKEQHQNLKWFEVVEQRGYIGNDGVTYYQAHLKIGYRA